MDVLGKLPCIACLQHGKESLLINLHHIKGGLNPARICCSFPFAINLRHVD